MFISVLFTESNEYSQNDFHVFRMTSVFISVAFNIGSLYLRCMLIQIYDFTLMWNLMNKVD